MLEQPGGEDARSPLVRDARALLGRAVRAIAESRSEHRESSEVLDQSRERLIWSGSVTGESIVLRDRLRTTVVALARMQRAKGTPPEKLVTLLKSLVIDAEAERLDTKDARSLVEDVVRWGIEAYYAT